MKKFLTLITLLVAITASSFASKTVYLKPNSNWLQASARFALYMWSTPEDGTWTDFTAVTGETNVYQATVDDKYTYVICCRMNPSSTVNNWDDGNKWNQTDNIPLNNDITVEIPAGSWDNSQTVTAIISSVAISVPNPLNPQVFPFEGEPVNNAYEREITELATTTMDVPFKLVVNGTALSYSDISIDPASASLLVEGTEQLAGYIIFKHSTSGYSTYTATATWTPSESATSGWTLKIVGKDKKKVTYTATFVNGANWSTVNAYAWQGDGSTAVILTDPFPGNAIEKTGTTEIRGATYDVYTFSLETDKGAPEKIIFSNGTIQTEDLDWVEGNQYEYGVLPGTAIWTSETPVEAAWYKDPYELIISKDQLANIKVGDIIHVAIQDVPAGLANEWDAQVKLKDGWWADATAEVNLGSGTVTDASFVVTGYMLTHFKERGFIVSGQKFSTKLVTVESTDITGSEKSIWVGNTSSYFNINNINFKAVNDWVYVGPESWDYAFEGIKAGDIIRVTTTELEGDSHWLVAHYNGADTNWEWKDYEETVMHKNKIPTGFDFTIPAEYVDQIKTDGVIINFAGYTVSQVELIHPDKYYIIEDLGQGWIVGDEMVEDEGVYSATLENMAGKYFAIIPNTSLNAAGDAILYWADVARPVANGNFLVEFKNYTGTENITKGTNSVWEGKASNDADLTINFTPATNSFSLTCEKTIDMSAAGYATYSNAEKFQVTEATAYIVKNVGANASMTQLADNPVLAGGVGLGTGVILKGAKAVIIPAASDAEAVSTEGNLLVGSGDIEYEITGQFSPSEPYTPYILMNGTEGVGFYKLVLTSNTSVEEKTLHAHKAFLAAPTGSAPFLAIDGETTGIQNIERTANDGLYYDLSGRRVENPTKGLYIHNGKKVVIK